MVDLSLVLSGLVIIVINEMRISMRRVAKAIQHYYPMKYCFILKYIVKFRKKQFGSAAILLIAFLP